MSTFEIEATVREAHGKGAARRTRMAGLVPAIVYGNKNAALSVAVNPKDVIRIVTGPKKRNAVITLKLKDAGGKASGARTVMVKDLQTDAVRREARHVDFLEVALDKPVTVRVPLDVTGKSKAINQGAKMNVVARTIAIAAKPMEIPEKISIDVTEEGFGVVRAKALKMPSGVALVEPPEAPIVSLRMPRGEKEEEAAAAPAAGAEAKPGDAKAGEAKPGDAKDAKAGDKGGDKGGDKKK